MWRSTPRCSPGAGTGAALEGAGDLRRDPAAVEPAGLGDDALAVDEACVHPACVERDVVAQLGERRTRCAVGPRRVLFDAVTAIHREVVRTALPLTERTSDGGRERVRRDVVRREVVVRRMAGLEYP